MRRFLIAERPGELSVKPFNNNEEDGIKAGYFTVLKSAAIDPADIVIKVSKQFPKLKVIPFRGRKDLVIEPVYMVTKAMNQHKVVEMEESQSQDDSRVELARVDEFKVLSSLLVSNLSRDEEKLFWLRIDILCDCIYTLDYWNSLGKTKVFSKSILKKSILNNIMKNKKNMPIKPFLTRNGIQDFCINQIFPFFYASNPAKLYEKPYTPIAAIDLLPKKIYSIFDLYIHETVTSAQLCLSVCNNLLNYAESNPDSYEDVENIFMRKFQQIAKTPYLFGKIFMIEEIFNKLNNRQFQGTNNLLPFKPSQEDILQGDNLERCIEEIIDTSTIELYMEKRKSMLEQVVAECKILDKSGNIDPSNTEKVRKCLYNSLIALVAKPSPFHYDEVINLIHKLNRYTTPTAKNYKLFMKLQHKISASPTEETNEEPIGEQIGEPIGEQIGEPIGEQVGDSSCAEEAPCPTSPTRYRIQKHRKIPRHRIECIQSERSDGHWILV